MTDGAFSRALAQAAIRRLDKRWVDNSLTEEQLRRWWALRLATGDPRAVLVQHILDREPPVPGPDGGMDYEPFVRACARWIHADEDRFVSELVAELTERGVRVEYQP